MNRSEDLPAEVVRGLIMRLAEFKRAYVGSFDYSCTHDTTEQITIPAEANQTLTPQASVVIAPTPPWLLHRGHGNIVSTHPILPAFHVQSNVASALSFREGINTRSRAHGKVVINSQNPCSCTPYSSQTALMPVSSSLLFRVSADGASTNSRASWDRSSRKV